MKVRTLAVLFTAAAMLGAASANAATCESLAAPPAAIPISAPGINDLIEAKVTTKEIPPQRNYAWAYLMMRVFRVDVLQCERCGGRMKILAAIHPPDATRRILDCLGLPSRAPPLAPAIADFTAHLDSF